MNNLFEKNINALAAKDSELAQRLRDYIVTDVPQLVKENGFYNFIYKLHLIIRASKIMLQSIQLVQII